MSLTPEQKQALEAARIRTNEQMNDLCNQHEIFVQNIDNHISNLNQDIQDLSITGEDANSLKSCCKKFCCEIL